MLLRGVIFQVRGQISKKVAGHFEEHKKLGRQPKFQKFLATGGLVIPRGRLIGGCGHPNSFNFLSNQGFSHIKANFRGYVIEELLILEHFWALKMMRNIIIRIL